MAFISGSQGKNFIFILRDTLCDKWEIIFNYLNLNYRVFNYTIDGGKIDWKEEFSSYLLYHGMKIIFNIFRFFLPIIL